MGMVIYKSKMGATITVKDVLAALVKGWIPMADLGNHLGISKGAAQSSVRKLEGMKLLVKDGLGYKLTNEAINELSFTGALLKTKVAKTASDTDKKNVPPWLREKNDAC
jgi:predicted transcriptional regulator